MRTKITLLGLITGLSLSVINAQKAPDFTITDFNSKTHKLYEDYLDKDKVIVIKFFFVGCPPCASIAPYVQSAYTRWGSGSGDVEFLQITTLSSDKNASVKSYHQSKGLTFPGVGSDGNSAQALSPYKSGNFGTWYGTPTFVVIAPNGDVDYNVNMSAGNPYGLDTAIARAFRKVNGGGGGGGGTGCTNAFSVKTITSIQPESYLIVDYLNGNPAIKMDSGSYNCEFQLPQNLDGIYVLPYIGSKADPVSGVTTGDIVRIQRHILKLDTLNNLQQKIADVNNSFSVTAADVSDIRKLILGVTSGFSKLTESYAVVHNPKSRNIFDSDNKVLIKDLVNKTKINEFGIGKYGDITGANLFKSNETVNRNSSNVQVYVEQSKLENGNYQYSFYIQNIDDLEAFQFAVNFQNTFIEQISTGQLDHPTYEMDYSLESATGTIRMMAWKKSMYGQQWNSKQAVLKVISYGEASISKVDETLFPTEFIFSNDRKTEDFKLMFANHSKNQISLIFNNGSKLIQLQSSDLIKNLEVLDVHGRNIFPDSRFISNGSHRMEIRTDLWPSGIYFVKVFGVSKAPFVSKIFIP
ncbi:MAG: redoxin domain-containing protein [Saprospiraceae bacterium]|nr:redoxin domain-containing protein [Saprospiraceae bacterium]